MISPKIVDFVKENFSIEKNDAVISQAPKMAASALLSTVGTIVCVAESIFFFVLSIPFRLGCWIAPKKWEIIQTSDRAIANTYECFLNIGLSFFYRIPQVEKVEEVLEPILQAPLPQKQENTVVTWIKPRASFAKLYPYQTALLLGIASIGIYLYARQSLLIAVEPAINKEAAAAMAVEKAHDLKLPMVLNLELTNTLEQDFSKPYTISSIAICSTLFSLFMGLCYKKEDQPANVQVQLPLVRAHKRKKIPSLLRESPIKTLADRLELDTTGLSQKALSSLDRPKESDSLKETGIDYSEVKKRLTETIDNIEPHLDTVINFFTKDVQEVLQDTLKIISPHAFKQHREKLEKITGDSTFQEAEEIVNSISKATEEFWLIAQIAGRAESLKAKGKAAFSSANCETCLGAFEEQRAKIESLIGHEISEKGLERQFKKKLGSQHYNQLLIQ